MTMNLVRGFSAKMKKSKHRQDGDAETGDDREQLAPGNDVLVGAVGFEENSGGNMEERTDDDGHDAV
jgi:hypothetical protein